MRRNLSRSKVALPAWLREPPTTTRGEPEAAAGATDGPAEAEAPVEPPEPPATPWRRFLPGWSEERRERWGKRANELAESGVAWPEDERRAFEEIVGTVDREAVSDEF